jgi:polyisoprenoid-binding protein YceI
MKTTKFLLALSTIIVLSAFTFKSSVNWQISDGYSVKFSGTDAEGIFKDLEGDVQFDNANPESSSFMFTVAVNSINTGKGMKNKHAVSDKWFDAEKYPNITFKSSSVSKAGDAFKVTGIMSIHGVSKEMTIPFAFNDNSFSSQFSVNRMDFGVGTMEGMSAKVSNEIKLDVTIPVTK